METATRLPATCDVAFKEWGVVCAALAAGQQTLIVRKGGIHEGRDGFRVEHRDFWLYPTAFHQEAESLRPDAQSLIAQVQQDQPPAGLLRLNYLAEVHEVFKIGHRDLLQPLAALQILSPSVLTQRYEYRHPGLFVLAVRIYALPQPIELPEQADFAGCRSWVHLRQCLSTAALLPVLAERDFQAALDDVRLHLR